MNKKLIISIAALAPLATAANAQLWIDFNSTTQDGGPHNQAGYQAYDAAHEVTADFVTMNYAAFGTTVGVTPSWPNTTDNRVQQMIDRGAGNDGNWDNASGDLDLITDWIGIDTRTGNGGNGDWDGAAAGTPTYMDITLTGVPAGAYNWTSFHHDTEHVHGNFELQVSLDGGSNFLSLGQSFYMSDSTTGGSPDSSLDGFPGPQTGPDALSLISTINGPLTTTGDTVVARFAPLANTAVHRQLFALNGFQLDVIPEPSAAILGLLGLTGLLLRRRR